MAREPETREELIVALERFRHLLDDVRDELVKPVTVVKEEDERTDR